MRMPRRYARRSGRVKRRIVAFGVYRDLQLVKTYTYDQQ